MPDTAYHGVILCMKMPLIMNLVWLMKIKAQLRATGIHESGQPAKNNFMGHAKAYNEQSLN